MYCFALRTLGFLYSKEIACYLKTKCCVEFYTEKNTNMYCKWSHIAVQIVSSSVSYLP